MAVFSCRVTHGLWRCYGPESPSVAEETLCKGRSWGFQHYGGVHKHWCFPLSSMECTLKLKQHNRTLPQTMLELSFVQYFSQYFVQLEGTFLACCISCSLKFIYVKLNLSRPARQTHVSRGIDEKTIAKKTNPSPNRISESLVWGHKKETWDLSLSY